MSRIREIAPELWQDEKFGRLSLGAQLLFIWTWNDADDWGVLRWNERRCKSGAFLYKERINHGHVREYVRELELARMVLSWEVDGERWGVVRAFLRWQGVYRPSLTRNPAPPAEIIAQLPDFATWKSGAGIRLTLKDAAKNSGHFPGWIRALALRSADRALTERCASDVRAMWSADRAVRLPCGAHQ